VKVNERRAGGKPGNRVETSDELLGKGSELGENQRNRVKTGKLFGKDSGLGENQRTGGKPVMSCLEKAANRLEKAASWGKTSKPGENR